MKKAPVILLAGMVLASACQQREEVNQHKMPATMEVSQNKSEENKIYMTALIYLKPGMEAMFEKYRAKAAAILEKHGGHLERIIRPTQLVNGAIELPSEIHFAVFDGPEGLKSTNEDPEYQKIVKELREPSVGKLIVIPSKLSDFEFEREVGDKSKIYGIALLNYNQGDKYIKQFEDYHNQVCEIMPEFGTHFERFLVPTDIKGDFEQPDEIHRFYFDSMEGLQQMGSDPRMLKLFPLRDQSLSQLNFIIGEAI